MGAALTLEPVPGFFRFNAAGTNAVASFLKSRSSGSAEMTAEAGGPGGVGAGPKRTPPDVGFGGNVGLWGCEALAARCA